MAEVHRIILVEGDHLQAEPMVEAITNKLLGTSVTHFRTESEFRTGFPEIVANPPKLVISEVIVWWQHPGHDPQVPAPADVLADDGFYRAGFRIQQMMAGNSRTEQIPFLLLSTLNAEGLERQRFKTDTLSSAYFLTKRGLNPIDLLEDIKHFLRGELPQTAMRIPEFAELATPRAKQ